MAPPMKSAKSMSIKYDAGTILVENPCLNLPSYLNLMSGFKNGEPLLLSIRPSKDSLNQNLL